jgi:hypothetical protein
MLTTLELITETTCIRKWNTQETHRALEQCKEVGVKLDNEYKYIKHINIIVTKCKTNDVI